MSAGTVTGSTWMMRQSDRTRRLLALVPAMIDQPKRVPGRVFRTAHVGLLYGYVGLKAHFRRLEEHWKAVKAVKSLDLERAGRRGYIIWAPPFVGNSAGIGCLYRLCHCLRERGIEAYMTATDRTAEGLQAPLVGFPDAQQLCRNGFAAIYPETISGNPLSADTVVRWVLNRPGLLGGDAVYPESEHIFYYSGVFLPYIKNAIRGKLYMPTIDESIFYCDESTVPQSQRTLECFYVGKSSWKDGYFDRERAFEITRDTPPKRELGKLFRAARVLYCFDNSTILIYEALMCGCAVVVIPDGTQQKQDYSKLELGSDGIAWGLGELSRTKVDVVALQERYRRVKREFEEQLDHLIATTYPRNDAPQHSLDSLIECCDS